MTEKAASADDFLGPRQIGLGIGQACSGDEQREQTTHDQKTLLDPHGTPLFIANIGTLLNSNSLTTGFQQKRQ